MASRTAGRPKAELTDDERAELDALRKEIAAGPLPYIRHYNDAHANEKHRRLMLAGGWGWYGMYWTLMELLAARHAHHYLVRDDAGWAFLSADMGTSGVPVDPAECRAFVEELARLDLIDAESLADGIVVNERVCATAEETARETARNKFYGSRGGRGGR